jgi:hypothetical protein
MIVADTLTVSTEDFEGGFPGWSVANTSLSFGSWEISDPIGTTGTAGIPIAPEDDAGGGADVRCWVTGNGTPGGAAGSSDLDGGPTILTSPVLNLQNTDAMISVDLWWYNSETNPAEVDTFDVEVSADGTNWVLALSLPGNDIVAAWENHSFQVGNFVTPSATVQVRFVAADSPNNSITEAGVDNFTVTQFACDGISPTFIRGDVNSDTSLDISDAVALLQNLFSATFILGCDDAADANDDGFLNIADPIRILEALFGGGALLGPPTACGVDPTEPDPLGCNSSGCP